METIKLGALTGRDCNPTDSRSANSSTSLAQIRTCIEILCRKQKGENGTHLCVLIPVLSG